MKCSLTRFLIGRALDDGREPPPAVRPHLARCETCAAWWRGQQALTGRLRSAARATESLAPAVPPFLQAKVFRAIRTDHADARNAAAVGSGFGRYATAAAAAAVLLGGGAIWLSRPSASRPPVSPPTPVALLPHTTVSGPGEGDGRNPLLLAAARLDQPLRREWSLLNADALAAVNALKSGFLPGGLLPE